MVQALHVQACCVQNRGHSIVEASLDLAGNAVESEFFRQSVAPVVANPPKHEHKGDAFMDAGDAMARAMEAGFCSLGPQRPSRSKGPSGMPSAVAPEPPEPAEAPVHSDADSDSSEAHGGDASLDELIMEHAASSKDDGAQRHGAEVR
eukprot:15438200-Alexandrium_andersonii.AAC.1